MVVIWPVSTCLDTKFLGFAPLTMWHQIVNVIIIIIITPTNHNRGKQHNKPIRIQKINRNSLKGLEKSAYREQ